MIFKLMLQIIFFQFDLVCDRGWLGELAMSIVGLGQTFGALFCNFFSDRYGRKPVFLTCLWSYLICGMAKAFSNNFLLFAILTFVNGFQMQVKPYTSLNGICCNSAIHTQFFLA